MNSRRAALLAEGNKMRQSRIAAMNRANRLLREIQLTILREKLMEPRNKIVRKSK